MKRFCPLLERETQTKILDYAPDSWVLLQCLETNFVFLENPPGYDALNKDFAWEKTSVTESDAREKAEPIRYSISKSLKKFRSQVLKRNKISDLAQHEVRDHTGDKINLLDLGCGWGGLLSSIIEDMPKHLQHKCVPYGVEISEELAGISNETMAKAGGHCVHNDAISGLLEFEKNHFDVIVLSSFLEHEIQPLQLLKNCHTHLKAGGAVIIKVPNYASINRSIRKEKWCGFRWPDHVNYFTPNTLKTMSKRAGLKVSRMNFMDCHPFSDNMYAVLQK